MSSLIEAALAQLAAGKVVAAATESYFGFLADIANPLAIEALFALKPRGSDKGVPIILNDSAAWGALVQGPIPSLARAFEAAFWPGGLSIALPAAEAVAARLALEGSLAVRLPGESPAAEVARRFGGALSATSANLPGAPPAVHAAAVHASFGAVIAAGKLLVIDGESPGGAPSTVVRVTGSEYTVMRAGRVPTSELAAVAQAHTAAPR